MNARMLIHGLNEVKKVALKREQKGKCYKLVDATLMCDNIIETVEELEKEKQELETRLIEYEEQQSAIERMSQKGQMYRVIGDTSTYFDNNELIVALEEANPTPMCCRAKDFVESALTDYDKVYSKPILIDCLKKVR